MANLVSQDDKYAAFQDDNSEHAASQDDNSEHAASQDDNSEQDEVSVQCDFASRKLKIAGVKLQHHKTRKLPESSHIATKTGRSAMKNDRVATLITTSAEESAVLLADKWMTMALVHKKTSHKGGADRAAPNKDTKERQRMKKRDNKIIFNM